MEMRSTMEIEQLVATKGVRPDLTRLQECIPSAYRDLMLHAWDQAPHRRPSFRDILKKLGGMRPSEQPFKAAEFLEVEPEKEPKHVNEHSLTEESAVFLTSNSVQRFKNYGLRRLLNLHHKGNSVSSDTMELLVVDRNSHVDSDA